MNSEDRKRLIKFGQEVFGYEIYKSKSRSHRVGINIPTTSANLEAILMEVREIRSLVVAIDFLTKRLSEVNWAEFCSKSFISTTVLTKEDQEQLLELIGDWVPYASVARDFILGLNLYCPEFLRTCFGRGFGYLRSRIIMDKFDTIEFSVEVLIGNIDDRLEIAKN